MKFARTALATLVATMTCASFMTNMAEAAPAAVGAATIQVDGQSFASKVAEPANYYGYGYGRGYYGRGYGGYGGGYGRYYGGYGGGYGRGYGGYGGGYGRGYGGYGGGYGRGYGGYGGGYGRGYGGY